MLKRLKILNIGPAGAWDLHLAPRLNLLTGDNGLGKTLVLDLAWAVLSTRFEAISGFPSRESSGDAAPGSVEATVEHRSGPRTDFLPEYSWQFDRRSQTWKDSWYLGRKSPGGKPREDTTTGREWRPQALVVYSDVNGGVSIYDAYQVGPSVETMAEAALRFSSAELWDGRRFTPSNQGQITILAGLIDHWTKWQEKPNSVEYQYLLRLLDALGTESEPLVPGPLVRVGIKDKRYIPTLAMPYGLVPVTMASAGMRRVLALAYSLIWAWSEHTETAKVLGMKPTNDILLLIDEVEAHLHPEWQRRILPAILRALALLAPNAAVQIIASTHSPLVMASLEAHFTPEIDNLFHFSLDQKLKLARVDDLGWAKQGDAGNWLVSESFGLRRARSVESQVAINAALAFMRGDRKSALDELRKLEPTIGAPRMRELQASIHSALSQHVPGHDEFWPTWIVTAIQRGTKAKVTP